MTKIGYKTWKVKEIKWKWTNPRRSWKSPDSLLASPLVSWWFLDPRSRGPWDRSWCAKSPPHSVSLAWCLPRRSSGIWPSATCRRSSGKNSTQLLTQVQPRTKPQGMKTSGKTSRWSLSRHSQITSGMPTTSGFFLDAFPAPRDPKSADFSSFHLEFWVFSLSFEVFSWVLTYFFMFFS